MIQSQKEKFMRIIQSKSPNQKQILHLNKNRFQIINSIGMQNRISEMENEEVDYLRFDRIKIQRKRMEHILEVIKDLSFKNKQLFKENAALKQERLQEGHYQKMYHQLSSERTILIQKNIEINAELQRYRETVFHQEMLINSLKEELYGENKLSFRPYFSKEAAKQQVELNLITQYNILQQQYESLKKEYSFLYKKIGKQCNHHKKHQNSHHKRQHFLDQSGKQNEQESTHHLGKNKSLLKINNKINILQEHYWVQLKQKYDKCKKAKKELSKQVKFLKQQLNMFNQRQKRHIQLIELLKQKRTKICECHINKLKKRMSQTTIQFHDCSSPTRT